MFIKNKNLKRGRKNGTKNYLNEVSYHGFGAINHITEEVKKNKFKKSIYMYR